MSQTAGSAAQAVATPSGKEIFGQPRGLATLFLTEMWERFTYYGMRAILILFMTASVAGGGLAIGDKAASSIYGLYMASTYLLSLLGGWIADRLVGAQRAVISGGALIMAGNAMLASGNTHVFFLGLVVAVFGVGLLKPNVSAIVAALYPEGGSRRDAGFSIFYVGINIGSFMGSWLVPVFAARFGWHWGFALPAIGMLIGLTQFNLTRRHLGAAGTAAAHDARGSWLPVIAFVAIVAVIAALVVGGQLQIDPVAVSAAATWLILIIAVGYFAYLFFFAGLSSIERRRAYAMAVLSIGCATFWAGYEQMGNSFNLFAERYTDLNVLGVQIPAGVLQAVNPFFILVFAPLLAALWLHLGRRGADLSAPAKFGIGLILMGTGFLVMYFASQQVLAGQKVVVFWLIATYLLHTLGELCLSPVGLSSMTKLAPARFVGQVMGIWFMATALGENLAGRLSAQYDASQLTSLPTLFMKIFLWGTISGGLMLLLTPALKRLMSGAR
ncbi:MAG TPA: oligopeptide:H+ symporter [Steroidobacteraceae bacterium]|nr:oligopeptide:H+ symporter [Steroidobacteraceae bacterium]